MASMVSISSLLFLLILCFQTQPSFQKRQLRIKAGWNDDLVEQCESITAEQLQAEQHQVNTDEIAKAISDKGYKIMSSVLQENLAFFSKHNLFCHQKNNDAKVEENMIRICGNITVFVASDDACKNHESISLDNHVVPLKMDKEAFYSSSVSIGSLLPTLHRGYEVGVTDDSSGAASINNVKINLFSKS